MKLFLILLIFSSIIGIAYTVIKCPDGQIPTVNETKCGNLNRCKNNDKFCYRTGDDPICCYGKFCVDTKMWSFSSPDDSGKLLFLLDEGSLNGVWHTRKINNVDATCPIPISALYPIKYNKPKTEEKVNAIPKIERLPYNNADHIQWREDGSVIMTNCSMNKDCEDLTGYGYVGYCYAPRNPSYTDPQIDKEHKFCYKLKQLDTISEYLIDPSKVGPKFCSQHSECADAYRVYTTYDPWFCHKMNNTYFDTTTKLPAGGLCIKSKTCNGIDYGVPTADYGSCDINDGDTCRGTGMDIWHPQHAYIPKCRQFQIGNNTENLCCYELTHKSIDPILVTIYYIAIIGLIPCLLATIVFCWLGGIMEYIW